MEPGNGSFGQVSRYPDTGHSLIRCECSHGSCGRWRRDPSSSNGHKSTLVEWTDWLLSEPNSSFKKNINYFGLLLTVCSDVSNFFQCQYSTKHTSKEGIWIICEITCVLHNINIKWSIIYHATPSVQVLLQSRLSLHTWVQSIFLLTMVKQSW